MNKSRKIVAKILNIVLVCFIALSIVIIVPACNKVPTENNKPEDNNPHTEHSYVYTKIDDDNHKKTCSGCTEIDVTEAHSYDNEQDTTCNYCNYVRELGGSELPDTAPSAVKLTVDKTELSAGDTFTLKIVISTSRTDMYWRAISLNVAPLLNATTVAPDIAQYFEVVSFTLDNVKFRNKSNYFPLTTDLFNSEGTSSFLISYAFIGADVTRAISTSENFELTAVIKIKDNTPAVSSFAFGVTELANNLVNFGTTDDLNEITDSADGRTSINNEEDTSESVGLSVNTITLSIK